MRAETRRQSSGPRQASAGDARVCWGDPNCLPLLMYASDWESVLSIDFWVTNVFQRVGKFTSTESVNNKDGLFYTFARASIICVCMFVY